MVNYRVGYFIICFIGENFIYEYEDNYDNEINRNNWEFSYKYNPSNTNKYIY